MSKMKLAGKTPLCVECNKFYSLKKMDEKQTAMAHETGLCPHCQTNADLVAQYAPVKVKPAQAIRNAFAGATSAMDANMLGALQSQKFCLGMFGMKYAFLKAIDVEGDVKEQLMVGDKARYGAKLVEVAGQTFAITNDLYEKNVERFVEWAASLDSEVAAA